MEIHLTLLESGIMQMKAIDSNRRSCAITFPVDEDLDPKEQRRVADHLRGLAAWMAPQAPKDREFF